VLAFWICIFLSGNSKQKKGWGTNITKKQNKKKHSILHWLSTRFSMVSVILTNFNVHNNSHKESKFTLVCFGPCLFYFYMLVQICRHAFQIHSHSFLGKTDQKCWSCALLSGEYQKMCPNWKCPLPLYLLAGQSNRKPTILLSGL